MADLLQQFETEERLGSARPRTQPLNPFEEAEVTLQQTVREGKGGVCVVVVGPSIAVVNPVFAVN